MFGTCQPAARISSSFVPASQPACPSKAAQLALRPCIAVHALTCGQPRADPLWLCPVLLAWGWLLGDRKVTKAVHTSCQLSVTEEPGWTGRLVATQK